MAKVRFKLSIENITFEYEGDQETGRAISDSMQNTLSSIAQAQNAVIDVTPNEEAKPALPELPSYSPVPKRPQPRAKPRGQTIDAAATVSDANGQTVPAKQSKSRRSRSDGVRAQTFRLLAEGYFSEPRTVADIQGEHAKRGFNYDVRRIASELTVLTKQTYLARDKNDVGKYAYSKGSK